MKTSMIGSVLLLVAIGFQSSVGSAQVNLPSNKPEKRLSDILPYTTGVFVEFASMKHAIRPLMDADLSPLTSIFGEIQPSKVLLLRLASVIFFGKKHEKKIGTEYQSPVFESGGLRLVYNDGDHESEEVESAKERDVVHGVALTFNEERITIHGISRKFKDR